VPAAAVIPAPIAYIQVVAVKKLVVECLGYTCGYHPHGCVAGSYVPSLRAGPGNRTARILHCEKIRVFKAGRVLE
jgi:hypothetical protein